MTYAQALEIAINAVDNDEASEKLTALKAQVEKKHVSSKPTKKQVENEAIKARMLDVLGDGESFSATELAKLLGDGVTCQKVSALLRQMGDTVQKDMVKGKAMFHLA